MTSLVPGSQPHRALWDTAGTALLLPALVDNVTAGSALTLAELLHIAGLPAEAAGTPAAPAARCSMDDPMSG